MAADRTHEECRHRHDIIATAKRQEFKTSLVWPNIFLLSTLHLFAIGSIYSFTQISWFTLFFVYGPFLLASLLGITAGAHRLWSHRAYKAKLPLRIFLMICQTIALQNDIYVWCRDHRVHHKYSETDADPHNSRRGFFFAHMGWLMMRKHPDVLRKGSSIDLRDLLEDPVVRFQRTHYRLLVIIFWLLIPTALPCALFGENLLHAFLTCVCFRYIFALHSTWLVNSAAHLYGRRPYDTTIEPRENDLVIIASFGEGYHNYHHTFPWDYSTSEFGWLANFNLTTAVIDLFAWFGQVDERKKVTRDLVHRRIVRTGESGKDPRRTIQFAQRRRHSLPNQVIRLLLGSCPLWFPICFRIICNYVSGNSLFN